MRTCEQEVCSVSAHRIERHWPRVDIILAAVAIIYDDVLVEGLGDFCLGHLPKPNLSYFHTTASSNP